MSASVEPTIFKVKATIAGINPMIWRRFLLRGETTIAQLHHILQLAFGWSDFHLHRFVIHGKYYGIPRPYGDWFTDDAHDITLNSLSLRVRERFLYLYDYCDDWQVQLRVEAITQPDPKFSYPKCIAGKRAAPLEDCAGPLAFQALHQENSELSVVYRVIQMMADEEFEKFVSQRQQLHYWLTFEKLDINRLNRRLQTVPLYEEPTFQQESITFRP